MSTFSGQHSFLLEMDYETKKKAEEIANSLKNLERPTNWLNRNIALISGNFKKNKKNHLCRN
ncbi:hypothetical protein GF376_02750 [Candidatus Peregrinibacteria bacterium]|nr:hypothetical protein [Candidatus Peregrinibacteria bacterium]